MLISNSDWRSYLNKRIVSGNLDFFVFLIISLFLTSITLTIYSSVFLPIFILIFTFFIYFGLFPRPTKGYTPVGYLFGLKISKIEPREETFNRDFLRFIYALLSPVMFLFYLRVKHNELGQFFYDKLFNTVVIDKSNTIELSDVKIKSNRHHIYYFFGENVKYLVYFILIIFLINIIVYIVKSILK